MKEKLTKFDIALLTYRNLMSVLKENKLYVVFRVNVGKASGKTICYQYFINDAGRYDNTFRSVSNYIDAINIIVGMSDGKELQSDKDIQLFVTNCTNTLIHNCIEPWVIHKKLVKFSKLEDIGRETFDRTCKKIFGNDFVDETVDDIPMEARRMILNGESINFESFFDRFIRERAREIVVRPFVERFEDENIFNEDEEVF